MSVGFSWDDTMATDTNKPGIMRHDEEEEDSSSSSSEDEDDQEEETQNAKQVCIYCAYSLHSEIIQISTK